MKKLLIMAMALLVSGVLQAQETKVKTEKKSFLVLHGGPSFPVDDFGSDNIGNPYAGFAKTGYTVNLNYGYLINKNTGITASAFYNSYGTKQFSMSFLEAGGETISLDMDHWKFYGLSAGPVFSFELSKKINYDIKLMGGMVNANSPKISFKGLVMANGDWSWAPALLGGVSLRMGTGSNIFVFANADYIYTKPKFSYTYTDENDNLVNEKIQQSMSVVNVSAGIGINF